MATSPVTREEPFLYVDSAGNYSVFVPAVQHNSSGTTWAQRADAGHVHPDRAVLHRHARHPVQAINVALARGKNLILTPGVYHLERTDHGHAPGHGRPRPRLPDADPAERQRRDAVADVPGVSCPGLIFDAGPQNSPALLQVGTARRHAG